MANLERELAELKKHLSTGSDNAPLTRSISSSSSLRLPGERKRVAHDSTSTAVKKRAVAQEEHEGGRVRGAVSASLLRQQHTSGDEENCVTDHFSGIRIRYYY